MSVTLLERGLLTVALSQLRKVEKNLFYTSLHATSCNFGGGERNCTACELADDVVQANNVCPAFLLDSELFFFSNTTEMGQFEHDTSICFSSN